jgi:hypothetical protein
MDTKNMITGQLIFRESMESVQNDPDKQLMMVVGVVSVPKNFNLKGEHKYTVSGSSGSRLQNLYSLVDSELENLLGIQSNEITITLYKESAENLSDETIGQSPSGIITHHNKWRV